MAAGYAITHPAVGNIQETAYSVYNNTTGEVVQEGWLGTLPTGAWIPHYIDLAMAMVMGGIPWQVINSCNEQSRYRQACKAKLKACSN